MSLADYTGLKSSISDWVHRGDVSAGATVVDDFIDMAEAEFNAILRVRSMEAQTDIAMSGGYINHPTDWLGWKRLSLITGGRYTDLQPAPLEYRRIIGDGSTGQSWYYSVLGSKTYFDKATNYTISTTYYQSIPALSTSNTTNWLLTKFPQAYLYGCLLKTEAYLQNDPRLQVWKMAYDEAMATVLKDSVMSIRGGQTPVMRTPTVF
jgi:hypothetical protein